MISLTSCNMNKVSFKDLTPDEQAEYGNGCGLEAKLLNVPDFIFTASCQQHDFNYERGGWFWDKVKADFDFFYYMWLDASVSKRPILYRIVSVIYFIGVFCNPISWFAFTYGRWRTKEEILLRDKIAKSKR